MAFQMNLNQKIEEYKSQETVCLYCGYDKYTTIGQQPVHHVDSTKKLHICPFCRRQICGEKAFRKLIFDDDMIEMYRRIIKSRDEWD